MAVEKKFDVICLGRAAVDLYAQQIGSRLEDAASFAKYLGGSSANMAYGAARQGLRVSMLTRVGNDHMGRFLIEEFSAGGVDTSHIQIDDKRLTGLVLLSVKDQENFPLIFYRNDCADMAIEKTFSESYIASARALVITGTHFSTEKMQEVCLAAVGYAKKNDVKIIVDIDYRPVLWGLSAIDRGEDRFVFNKKVSEKLQQLFSYCDLIVGTEEEVHIGGGSTNTITALKSIRSVTQADIVLKRGALGSTVIQASIPENLDQLPLYKAPRVDVLNVLGAGDAFMTGYLRGYLQEGSHEKAALYANACGAIVVSRHGCAPAIPSRIELDYYVKNLDSIKRPDLDKHLNYLHRVTTKRRTWTDLCILAFDHRMQFEQMAAHCKVPKKQWAQKIEQAKHFIAKGFYRVVEQQQLGGNAGLLADDRFASSLLMQATGRGLWIGRPVEMPGQTPVVFERDDVGLFVESWPEEHIIKCLAFFRSKERRQFFERKKMAEDDHALKVFFDGQLAQIKRIFSVACQANRELLLEIICDDEEDLLKHMGLLYKEGITPNWWKVTVSSEDGWSKISSLIDEHDPHCQGVLLLGLEAPLDQLKKQLDVAVDKKWCRGFAVGRSFFAEALQHWLQNDIDDEKFVEQVAAAYGELAGYWMAKRKRIGEKISA